MYMWLKYITREINKTLSSNFQFVHSRVQLKNLEIIYNGDNDTSMVVDCPILSNGCEDITSVFIIRDMKVGGAARSFRVLSPTAVIEFGSIWRIIGAQFIVPS